MARQSDTIRVAGAGLAGLCAALRLARHGFDVEIVEAKKRIAPSSGPHTEALRSYADEDILADLRRNGFDMEPFAAVQKTIRKSVHFQNALHGPAYFLYMRGRGPETVDQLLYRRCLDSGVRFRFGVGEGNAGPFNIVATGPPPNKVNMIGAGFTFSAEGSNLDSQTVYALLDNEVAPGGYLVITPGLGFHSIYSVSWRELRYDVLARLTESALHLPWVQEILGSSRRIDKIFGKAYYSPDPIRTSERDGVLYVGEAGGFQDAIAGFGFRYAVLTASFAAESIVDGTNYRDLLQKRFGREFEYAFAVRQKLDSFTNFDFDRLVESLGPETTLDEYQKRRHSGIF